MKNNEPPESSTPEGEPRSPRRVSHFALPRKRRKPKKHRSRMRSRIYFLPSALTLGNMFFGFYAIMLVIMHYQEENFTVYLTRACFFLILAGFFDLLDGKVARLTKTTSDFGLQLDSLSDAISFGLAPGIIAFGWALAPYRRFGWLAAFFFLACAVIRLARFNIQSTAADPRYFIGLPSPAAAAAVITFALFAPEVTPGSILSYAIIVYLYVISYLMISKFRYRSFKEIDLKKLHPIRTLFLLLVTVIIIMHEPSTILFLLALSYTVSGILNHFITLRLPFRRQLRKALHMHVQDLEDEEFTGDQIESEES